MICWRGHLTRITKLGYISSSSLIISAAVDGSVRIWWGKKGRFTGFFGQQRALTFPSSEETAGICLQPYDITEVSVLLEVSQVY